MLEGILFANTLLDQVVYLLKYFHSTIIPYAYQYYNKQSAHLFKPHTCYCHIYLAFTSVHCERKMHRNNHSKNIHSKEVDILISKNQAIQILYIKHHTYQCQDHAY